MVKALMLCQLTEHGSFAKHLPEVYRHPAVPKPELPVMTNPASFLGPFSQPQAHLAHPNASHSLRSEITVQLSGVYSSHLCIAINRYIYIIPLQGS